MLSRGLLNSAHILTQKGLTVEKIQEMDLGTLSKCYIDLFNAFPADDVETAVVITRIILSNGDAKLMQHDFDGATAVYLEVLRLSPRCYLAYNCLGLVFGMRGLHEKAIENFNLAIQLNQMFSEAYNNRAMAYRNINCPVKSEENLNTALQLNPRDYVALNNLGWKKCLQKNYAEAELDLDKSLALNPYFSEAYNNRGIVRERLGRAYDAMFDFNRAIGMNPNFFQAYNNRAFLKEERGDLVGALADFDEAIRSNPNYSEAYNNRGLLKKRMGLYSDALLDLGRAAELAGDNLKLNKARRECQRELAASPMNSLAGALNSSNSAQPRAYQGGEAAILPAPVQTLKYTTSSGLMINPLQVPTIVVKRVVQAEINATAATTRNQDLQTSHSL